MKNFLFFIFHLLLSPLESIQNKEPIFGEENLHFFPYFTGLSAGTQKSLQKEKEQKRKIFHKSTSTPSYGGAAKLSEKVYDYFGWKINSQNLSSTQPTLKIKFFLLHLVLFKRAGRFNNTRCDFKKRLHVKSTLFSSRSSTRFTQPFL